MQEHATVDVLLGFAGLSTPRTAVVQYVVECIYSVMKFMFFPVCQRLKNLCKLVETIFMCGLSSLSAKVVRLVPSFTCGKEESGKKQCGMDSSLKKDMQDKYLEVAGLNPWTRTGNS